MECLFEFVVVGVVVVRCLRWCCFNGASFSLASESARIVNIIRRILPFSLSWDVTNRCSGSGKNIVQNN